MTERVMVLRTASVYRTMMFTSQSTVSSHAVAVCLSFDSFSDLINSLPIPTCRCSDHSTLLCHCRVWHCSVKVSRTDWPGQRPD